MVLASPLGQPSRPATLVRWPCSAFDRGQQFERPKFHLRVQVLVSGSLTDTLASPYTLTSAPQG